MFENEIAINQFQLGILNKIAADLDEATLYKPSPGHGHPPVWVLGHLAITGEFGVSLLGGAVKHREWLPLFGPGSSDAVPSSIGLSKALLVELIPHTYKELQERARAAAPDSLRKPHGFAPFEGTPLQNVGHMTALLLTNHFAFHLSQLSSCRRSAGLGPLF